jgi:2-iminobutanoate/2-iminopropanoate deaminase
MRRAVMVPGAPNPGGYYSHAIVANGFVYVSGQVPREPASGRIPDRFADQVRLAMQNVQFVLRGVGTDLPNVVKITTYLTDMTRFAEYNDIYREFFPTEPPARTTVGCQLHGFQIEIDCIAVLP